MVIEHFAMIPGIPRMPEVSQQQQVSPHALTDKKKDSSNPRVFVQSLFFLVTQGKKNKKAGRFDSLWLSQNSQPGSLSTEFESEVFFLKKEIIKQLNYSLLTTNGFLLSLIRSFTLSRAVAAPWPVPPQGSHVSSTRVSRQETATSQVRPGEQ